MGRNEPRQVAQNRFHGKNRLQAPEQNVARVPVEVSLGGCAHFVNPLLLVVQRPQLQVSAFERRIETNRVGELSLSSSGIAGERESLTERKRTIRAFRLLLRSLAAEAGSLQHGVASCREQS